MNQAILPKKCRQLVAVMAFFVLATCSKTASTRALLDLGFLDNNRKLRVLAPSQALTGVSFSVVVQFTDPSGNDTAGIFPQFLSWSAVGAGTFTQTAAGSVSGNTFTATLIYTNSALTLGQSNSILLRATDPSTGISGVSNSITTTVAIGLGSFKIAVPSQVFQNTNFATTITAIGTDGNTFANYSGSVVLTITVAGMATPDGVLSQTSVTNFVAGVATLNLQYSKPAGGLTIKTADSADGTRFGTSNPILVAGDAFSLSAVPVTISGPNMNAIRISWTSPNNSYSYRIHRQTSPGVFMQLSSSPVFNPTYYLNDTDPTLTLGQSYTYKVEVRDSIGNLLRVGLVSTLLQNCTAIGTSTLSTNTNWAIGASPYCISGTITLNAALSIDPGVVLLFNSAATITVGVGGSISSVGTSTLPITYSANTPTPSAGYWGGVTLQSSSVVNNLNVISLSGEAISETNGSTGTTFSYSIFEYAGPALNIGLQVWIENSVFRNNKDSGGACASWATIHINMPIITQWAVLKGNVFISNAGTCYVGDIYVPNGGAQVPYGIIDFKNNYIQGSHSVQAGSMFVAGATISGNSFYNTYTTSNGVGAIYDAKGSFIRNNYFYNVQGGSASGGAIQSSISTITNNIFEGTYSSSAGGSISISYGTISGNTFKNTYSSGTTGGGAIFQFPNGPTQSLNIQGNTFVNTYGSNGGAIYIKGAASIQYNSFYGTYVTGGSQQGGAVFLEAANANNNVSYNNFVNTYSQGVGGAIYAFNNPNAASTVISHNTFNNTLKSGSAGTFEALYNNAAAANATYQVSSNWWSSIIANGVCDLSGGACETAAAGFPSLTTNAASAWPLCCNTSSDPTCVGATTLPSYQTCN